jgi:hypothetical protein
LAGSTAANFILGSNKTGIAVSGNLNAGCTINVTNGDGFCPGNYTLFSFSGTLSSGPTLGNVPTGYNCTLSTNTAHQINLVVASPAVSPPSFGGISVGPGPSLIFTGTGGLSNASYSVLTSTNIMLPVSQWSVTPGGQFDGAGNFLFTNTPAPGSAGMFYLLRVP